MSVANVVWTHQSWQISWSLKDYTVVEHLNLNLCSLDVVCSVAATIHYHFLYSIF